MDDIMNEGSATTNTITMVDEDGLEVVLEVIEETKINGINYLLAADEDDMAYIFKDVSKEGAKEATYEEVEDEKEVEYISMLFEELLDDIELQ